MYFMRLASSVASTNLPSLHVDLPDGPHFDRAVLRPRNPRGNRNRLVEIFRLNQVVAAELLLGFREWPVRHYRLAVAHANRGGRRGLLERIAALVLPALREVLREDHIFLEHLALLGGVHLFSVRFAVVDQKQVFHCMLSLLRFRFHLLVERRYVRSTPDASKNLYSRSALVYTTAEKRHDHVSPRLRHRAGLGGDPDE